MTRLEGYIDTVGGETRSRAGPQRRKRVGRTRGKRRARSAILRLSSPRKKSFAWYQQSDAFRHHGSHLLAQTAGSNPWREVGKDLGPVSLGEEEEGPRGDDDDARRARALFSPMISQAASVSQLSQPMSIRRRRQR